MQCDILIDTSAETVDLEGVARQFRGVCPPTAESKKRDQWATLLIGFASTVPSPILEVGKHYRITITEFPDE